jgi:RHS repeat-associated protein
MPYNDTNTNTSFTPFRVYSPNLGRWLSPDRLGGDVTNPQSLDRYGYVMNSPLSNIDPTGQACCGRTYILHACDVFMNNGINLGWNWNEFDVMSIPVYPRTTYTYYYDVVTVNRTSVQVAIDTGAEIDYSESLWEPGKTYQTPAGLEISTSGGRLLLQRASFSIPLSFAQTVQAFKREKRCQVPFFLPQYLVGKRCQVPFSRRETVSGTLFRNGARAGRSPAFRRELD